MRGAIGWSVRDEIEKIEGCVREQGVLGVSEELGSGRLRLKTSHVEVGGSTGGPSLGSMRCRFGRDPMAAHQAEEAISSEA